MNNEDIGKLNNEYNNFLAKATNFFPFMKGQVNEVYMTLFNQNDSKLKSINATIEKMIDELKTNISKKIKDSESKQTLIDDLERNNNKLMSQLSGLEDMKAGAIMSYKDNEELNTLKLIKTILYSLMILFVTYKIYQYYYRK